MSTICTAMEEGDQGHASSSNIRLQSKGSTNNEEEPAPLSLSHQIWTVVMHVLEIIFFSGFARIYNLYQSEECDLHVDAFFSYATTWFVFSQVAVVWKLVFSCIDPPPKKATVKIELPI